MPGACVLRRDGTGLGAVARFLCTGCTGRRQAPRALHGRVVPKAARPGLLLPVSAPARRLLEPGHPAGAPMLGSPPEGGVLGNLAWSIGKVRITRIVEREVPIALDGLLPDATPDAVARHRSWLEPHFLNPDGTATLSIHGLVVESAGQRILVDTCVGEHVVPGFEELSKGGRHFLRELEQAGFPSASIDVVLCTHMHFDHVGWNTVHVDGRWLPAFPNARYLFARAEWEHWSDQRDTGFTPTLAESVQPVLDAGQADLVEMDHRITPELRLEPSPGHTPGHVCVAIASGGTHALVTGDATHHPVQWAESEWKMVADTDGAQASATRRRLRGDAIASDALVIGTHYASPCAGRIDRKSVV